MNIIFKCPCDSTTLSTPLTASHWAQFSQCNGFYIDQKSVHNCKHLSVFFVLFGSHGKRTGFLGFDFACNYVVGACRQPSERIRCVGIRNAVVLHCRCAVGLAAQGGLDRIGRRTDWQRQGAHFALQIRAAGLASSTAQVCGRMELCIAVARFGRRHWRVVASAARRVDCRSCRRDHSATTRFLFCFFSLSNNFLIGQLSKIDVELCCDLVQRGVFVATRGAVSERSECQCMKINTQE
jgi:hypothetical protein